MHPTDLNAFVAATGDMNTGAVIGWSLVLILLVVGGFSGVTFFRKWLSRNEEGPKLGFTLGDLRDMMRDGRITEEEYERARTQMIAATQRATERAAAQAAEAAKSGGGPASSVTDIDELRRRAKRNLENGGNSPPPPSA